MVYLEVSLGELFLRTHSHSGNSKDRMLGRDRLPKVGWSLLGLAAGVRAARAGSALPVAFD
jgi:hypothetical protein